MAAQVKKQISQETFNEVVKENMEEFEMTVEEAVEDAIKQFEAQGVDLSNIATTVTAQLASDPTVELTHPVIESMKRLEEFSIDDSCNFDDVRKELDTLYRELADDDARILAGSRGCFPLLMGTCERAAELVAEMPPDMGSVQVEQRQGTFHAVLNALSALLKGQPDLIMPPNPDAMFAEAVPENEHVNQLVKYLKQFPNSGPVQEHGIRAIKHACTMHENNRLTFVATGLIELLLHCISEHTDHPAAVAEGAHCLRTLTLDDDIRVAFGKGHDHAKLMVTDHGALSALMSALASFTEDADTTAELCKTLATLAVRSEFCKEIVDLGGLKLLLNALALHEDSITVCSSCMSLVRAVAGNDEVKKDIREAGGIPVVISVMTKHPKSKMVMDNGCSAIAALCLRDNDNSQLMVEHGAAHVIVKAMHMHPEAHKLQKNACRAIRNIVARNHSLRPAFLGESAEHYINLALRVKQCHDDAKAALRDLGCKVELRELWTGAPRDTKEEI
eukprot:m.6389 g.6389  ORF g.6389 m.6389 type:complete len:504 (+) comp5151_c0_seq1:124-1635(+)